MNKKRFIAAIFILLNLFYLIISEDSAPKRGRSEGHYAPVSLIKNSKLKPGDTIILTYYDSDKFERYLNKTDNYNFKSINKFNFNYFMFNNNDYIQTIKQGKSKYRQNFGEFPNRQIIDNIWKYFLYNTKKGDRIGIVFLDTVCFLSNENIQDIIDEDNLYYKTPFIFLVFSTLRNNLLYSMRNSFKLNSITQAGDWTLFVYERK